MGKNTYKSTIYANQFYRLGLKFGALAASHAHGLERINTVLGWGLDPAGPAAAGVLERSPH